MRRLPVFILADVSESMVGEAIASMQAGVKELLEALLRDPQMMETGALSIITFGDDARVALCLTDVMDAHVPEFEVSSGTCLGRAFEVLAREIHDTVKKTTAEVRGDYKPIIFVITDGQPTDEWHRGLALFRKAYPTVTVHAIGCGEDVDYSVLKEITSNTYAMGSMTSDAFRKLFCCITASVRSVSASLLMGNTKHEDLTFWDEEALRKPSDEECVPLVEPRQVLIPGVCSNTGKHYLVRYRKNEGGVYKVVSTHPLKKRLRGGENGGGGKISVEKLDSTGMTCPHCENQEAFYCNTCHEWVCNEPNQMKGHCPDCGWEGRLVYGSFDVSRAKG